MSRAILVVEDDEHIRQFVKTVLSREGYEVIIAANGVSALMQIKCHAPDLILLDMHMPRMNGNAFLSVYSTMQERVPVVVVTVDPLTISSREATVVEKVLVKPFTMDELLDCVQEFLPPGFEG